MLPEIILLAEAEDALGGDADLVAPDGEGLVVRRRRLAAGEHRGYRRSGSRPTHSGLVRNSHDQAIASCLK